MNAQTWPQLHALMEADLHANNPQAEQFGSIEEAQAWFKQQSEWVLSDE